MVPLAKCFSTSKSLAGSDRPAWWYISTQTTFPRILSSSHSLSRLSNEPGAVELGRKSPQGKLLIYPEVVHEFPQSRDLVFLQHSLKGCDDWNNILYEILLLNLKEHNKSML